MSYFYSSDVRLYYETSGDPGAPPLLLLSGWTDYAAKCAWQAGPLAADFFVVTLDNRGAGRSDQPPPGYSLDDMADDAAALLDELGLLSAHVFAFSMGGMIALHLALRHPRRVRSLALGCTTAGGRLMVPPSADVIDALSNPVVTGDRRRDFLAGSWVSLGPNCVAEQPELVAELADQAAANPQTDIGYLGQFQAIRAHDVADELHRIHAPTLVLHGEQDRLMPPENGRLLADGIAGARLILYPDAGHLFFVERAAQVNDDLRRFLLTVEATQPVQVQGSGF